MSEYQVEYKGYYIKPHREHPKSYVIVTEGRGGKIPDIMAGLFTDKKLAMSVIDFYLSGKETNAQTRTKSRN